MQPANNPSELPRPPDPPPPSDASLARVCQFATHSSNFRCYLRTRRHYLNYLSYAALSHVYQETCRSPPEDKSTEELIHTITDYLDADHLVTIDEEWESRYDRATCEEERRTLRAESTEAPPFLNRHQPKRKSNWSEISQEEDEEMATSRPLPTRPTTPPLESQDSSPPKLSQSISMIIGGLGKATSAITQAMGLLQNVLDGSQPSKKQLNDCLQVMTIAREGMSTQKSGLELCRGILEICDNDVIFAKNPQDAIQQQTKSFMQPLGSYARVVKMDPRQKDKRPNQSKPSRKQLSKTISAIKSSIRVDERSIKLRAVKGNGALPPGTIAAAVASLIDETTPVKDIVEDVRSDARGTVYVQLCEAGFDQKMVILASKTDKDQTIRLGSLGVFAISNPTKCAVAGFCPLVVAGVNLRHTPEQVLTEIWDSNSVRWGLSEEQAANHIAGVCRLNRRKNPDQINPDGPSNPADRWEPSKSVKIYVSSQLLQCMKSHSGNDGMALRYEYEFLHVKIFNHQRRRCDNCGQLTTHSSRACRNKTKCHMCGEAHLASDCPQRSGIKHHSPAGSSELHRDSHKSRMRESVVASTLEPTSRKEREKEMLDMLMQNDEDMAIDQSAQSPFSELRARRR